MASEDLQAATESLEALNVAEITQDPGSTITPRANFPIPRELRDIIYSFLLYNDNVQAKPYRTRDASTRGKFSESHERDTSNAHTYRFYTNILGVNGQINEEASKILVSNNFILVSHVWPDMSFFKHHLALPIFTENQAYGAKFKLHILRIHVEASKVYFGFNLAQGVAAHSKPESFIMAASDLPRFCFLMRYLHAFYAAPAKRVTHLGGARASNAQITDVRQQFKMPAPTLKLQLQDKLGTTLSSKALTNLLNEIRVVCFGMQKVKLLNFNADWSAYIAKLKSAMSPRSIWTQAQVWNTFEIVRSLMAEGGALTLAKDHAAASKRYEAVLSLFSAGALAALDKTPHAADTRTLIAITDCLAISCAITENAIRIKDTTLDIIAGSDTMELIGRATQHANSMAGQRGNMPPSISLGARWCSALNMFLLTRTPASIEQSLSRMQTLAQGEMHGFQDFIKYDLKLIASISSSAKLREFYLNENTSTTKKLCEMTSIARYGIPTISSGNAENMEKPSNIEGLIDKAHYEALLAEDLELATSLL